MEINFYEYFNRKWKSIFLNSSDRVSGYIYDCNLAIEGLSEDVENNTKYY